MRLLASDLQKIRRRRGLFWGSGIVCTLTALVGLAIRLLEHNNAPWSVHNVWGFFSNMSLVVLICTVIAGSILGSWDQARGTQRYLLMGGATRSKLLVAHALAVIVYSLLLSLWVLFILGIIAISFPGSGGFEVSDSLRGISISIISSGVFGLLAFSIGTFFAEVGIAVAASIVMIFAAGLIQALLVFLSTQLSWLKGAEHGMITDAMDNLQRNARTTSSAVVVVVWLVVCLGLAWLRVSRRDY